MKTCYSALASQRTDRQTDTPGFSLMKIRGKRMTGVMHSASVAADFRRTIKSSS